MYRVLESSLFAIAVCHIIYFFVILAGIPVPYVPMLLGSIIGAALGNIAFGGK